MEASTGCVSSEALGASRSRGEDKEIDYVPSAPPYFTFRRPHKSTGVKITEKNGAIGSKQQSQGDDADNIPSAPPMEVSDSVTGYEALSFDTVSCPPPSQYGDFEWLDPSEPLLSPWTAPGPDCTLIHNIPQVTEAVARTALMGYVKNHCCWGVGAAKNMTITSFRPTTSYHYVLHTFTEKREARWAWSPHIGGEIDGPDLGTPPSPWEISATPAKPFCSEVKHLEVPHTATVKPCHRCKGVGTLACSNCHGKGWTRCLACHGEGFGSGSERERCIVCGTLSHGHGRQDCTRCSAKGRITCSICDAYGQLKCFIQVTVSWKVVTGEHVVGGEDLPPDLIRQVEGQVGLEETGIRLAPLPSDIIPDETLAMASAQLIQEHLETSSDSLILAQRHQVRIVPITAIGYQWKGHVGNYYIYGLEKRVFTSDYPQTCCCGCNIL